MIGREEREGAENLGEEKRIPGRGGAMEDQRMERLQREKLMAWRNSKLYGII